MEARIITDRQQWNDFVADSSYGSITQSYEWGELVEPIGPVPLRIGVVGERGKLCAAMCVLVTRAPMLGNTYLYAPRGPILDDPLSPAMQCLLDFTREQARAHKAFMLKIEPSVEDGERRWQKAFQRYGFHTSKHPVHPRNEWILDIRPSEEELLANMKAEWRRNIRLAERKGVVIRQGQGKDDIHNFHRLLQQTSERNNFFVHGEDYFERFMQLFSKTGVVLLLAEHEGEVVGGAVLMRFGPWTWYRFGASSLPHRELRANHLVQWTAIRWAKSHGCQYYNLLGIPTDLTNKHDPLQGVYFFKHGFGGYARLAMEGQDLVYKPVAHSIYQGLRNFKYRVRQ